MDPKPTETVVGARTEQRIARLTLWIGLAAGVLAGFLYQGDWGAGIAVGATLAWLNFRWLRRGLDALVAASTAQAGAEKRRVPVGTYFLMVFRYGLLALSVYVIFRYLQVPLLSMILGLCALGAATMAASVYEILRPVE